MSYHISVCCSNCGYEGIIEVKSGELVSAQKCPTCGCERLSKSYGVRGYKEEES